MQHAFDEVSIHHEHAEDAVFKKRVRKTTVLLSYHHADRIRHWIDYLHYSQRRQPQCWAGIGFKGMVCILTLAKAYYIVSVFMHLGDEIRNMIMTIVVPLMLFIWFIIAFIADGNSYKNLRNKFDQHFKETTMPAKHHKTEAPVEKPGGKE
jgi:hypothetical protein